MVTHRAFEMAQAPHGLGQPAVSQALENQRLELLTPALCGRGRHRPVLRARPRRKPSKASCQTAPVQRQDRLDAQRPNRKEPEMDPATSGPAA